MATSIFAIGPFSFRVIMTIHRYQLVIMITRRHLPVVIIDLGTMVVVMAGFAIILHVVQTHNFVEISFRQFVQDERIYGKIFNDPAVVIQAF